MVDDTLQLLLVVCRDRAMQEALRDSAARAGWRTLAATSIAAAEPMLARQRPALILVDPALGDASALARHAPVEPIPVRTSSSGVRRLAKHSEGAGEWLRSLIERDGR